MSTPTETNQRQYFQMIAVNHKKISVRRAVAQGRISMSEKAFSLIKNRQLPKGDALMLAEVAGIMGAKKTAELIPLCHPLPLDHVSVKTELDAKTNAIIVYCETIASAKTGVEMEALSGVNTALLAIYDLTKMIEPALNISDVKLLIKEGGKQGCWIHPDGLPTWLHPSAEKNKKLLIGTRVGIVTVSDRATEQKYQDKSGPVLKNKFIALGAQVEAMNIIPDDKARIIQCIQSTVSKFSPHLIILTGGTGFAPNDVTPAAITEIADRIALGLGELLRHDSARLYTKYAWLSNCMAGIYGKTLIIALPGNPKACEEGMEILQDLLPHALLMVKGGDHD